MKSHTWLLLTPHSRAPRSSTVSGLIRACGTSRSTPRDVAEMLVAGRERPYLRAFFDVRIFNPFAIGPDDFDVYVNEYSAPGAMRAGFELYRAFDRDADENRASLQRNGKLTIPVLAVGGTISTSGSLVAEMMREVAINVTEYRVPQTAHWVPEENASAFSRALLEFLNA